jgi:single-stranded DNA-binding protein
MATMKIITVVGSMGSKPAIRTSNGTTYTNFNLAVIDRDRNGEEVTEWYEVVAFRGLAQTAADADTGDQLLVHGTFQQTVYTGMGGVRHHDIEIKAWRIEVLNRTKRPRPAPQPAA